MTRSTFLATTYATDEDIYAMAPSDFGVFVSASNCYGIGTNGVITGGWTLESATNDFAAQGVAAGMVLHLENPVASFTPKRELFFAVDSVGTTTLAFRHCGEDAGKGMPPVAAAGLAGVSFSILTLKAQIENAAYKLNTRFAIDPLDYSREPTDIYDPRMLRDLTAYWVVYHLYADSNRTKDGDFAGKVAFYRQQYEEALDRAVLRWGPTGQSLISSSPRFGRLSR